MKLREWDKGMLLTLGVVGVFVLHRLLVILSAGDFLYPLEPSEAKNTQIAWDLMTGRFGTDGFSVSNYITNSGSIHHGSYSTAAISYFFVSRFTGFGLLSVRLVPLLFTAAGLFVWLEILRRTLGRLAVVLGGLSLLLVPTLFIGFQLTFLGCHPESILPLAVTAAAWLAWLHEGEGRRAHWAALGACIGYSLIFSYLLWPFLALMAGLSFLGPRPRASRRTVGAGLIGLVVGLWPLWIIFLLGGPNALFGSAITEREETTMRNMALGSGLTADLYWNTLRQNLPAGFHDFWMNQRTAPSFWGGMNFEPIAYKILVFGSLGLLPWAAAEKKHVVRRLLLLIAVAPPLVYLWLVWASPWKPHIPVRYFLPFALLGFSAPAVMAAHGLSRARAQQGWRRSAAVLLFLAGAGTLAWTSPMRAVEGIESVRLERAGPLFRHRYVAYYNLGMGTIWAEMVDEVNDMIDVRSSQEDTTAFHGFQAALWGSGRRLALGEGDWQPPEYEWGNLQSGLNEWAERDSYSPPGERDDPRWVALNIGWGAGIRSRWNTEVVAGVAEEAAESGSWPERLSWTHFWEGYGFGLGRALPDMPAHPASLPDTIPENHRGDVTRGMEEGRALGEVPKAPRKPTYSSVRNPAT